MSEFESDTEEDLSVLETDNLTYPDGTDKPFTAPRLWWLKYRYLILSTDFDHAYLLNEAVNHSREFDTTLEYALTEMIIHMYYEVKTARDAAGISI